MSFIAVAGSTYTFGVSLEDQANAGLFKAAPTIAAGDFQRSINGGAFANLDNLPTVTPSGGKRVQIVLSASETTSAADGGNIYIVASDASGAEWYSLAVEVRVRSADLAATGAEMDIIDAPNATAVAAIQGGLALASAIGTPSDLNDGGASLAGMISDTYAQSIIAQQLLGGFDGSGNTVLTWFKALLRKDAALPDGIGGTYDPASDSQEALADALAVVDGVADAILEDTGTTLPGLLSDLQGADSDTLETLSDQLDAVSTLISVELSNTSDSTASGAISRTRGNTWSISATIGAITGYTSLWFTVKHSKDDADSEAILQIKLNEPSANDGLIYKNGSDSVTAGNGSITVSDDTTGEIIIALDEADTDDMPVGAFYYDIQALIGSTITTPDSGTFTVTADVTRSIT